MKQCLFTVGAGSVLLLLGACSQTSEPELEADAEAVAAESADKADKKEEKKQKRKRSSKPDKKAEAVKETPAAPAPEECLEEAHPELVQAGESAEASAASATPDATAVSPAPFSPPPAVLGKRIAQVKVNGPYVAVTFDDGPNPNLTPKVLDIFKRHGAHATFFVLGRNANQYRSILARAVAEGHEIGGHSWSHINMQASSSAKIISEFDRTNAVIEKATGSRPKVMRPPYGSVNKKLVNMVYQRYGTPSILWDVDTNDWRKPGVETVIRRAVNNAKPGSIILMHDIHASTVAAVERIVTGLQARGFKLVTVSELMELGRQAKAAAAAPATPAVTPDAAAPAPQLPLPTQQQQQQMVPATLPLVLPDGSASIGAAPAVSSSAPTATPAAPAAETPQNMPAEVAPSPAAISAGHSTSSSPVIL